VLLFFFFPILSHPILQKKEGSGERQEKRRGLEGRKKKRQFPTVYEEKSVLRQQTISRLSKQWTTTTTISLSLSLSLLAR
jgi:hypothetical protein